MNRFTGSALLLLTLVFNACRVSTKVSLPQSSLPAEFRDHVSTDTTTIADIPWKTFFADATLQQLIDSALINNYDMQYALKNMEAAQLMMRQAKWNYVPAASLNVTASTNRPSDNSLNGISLNQFLKTTHIEDYTAGLTLSWEADIWGKIRNQRKSALAKYLQSAEARKLVQTSLVTAIAQGYYNLLMLDEQLLIAQRNVALNDSTLQMIRLQYDAGQVTSLAVEYAEAQQLTAAALVPQMEQNIALQENALRILTGALPDKVNRSSNWKDQPFADALPAGIPASLLSRRPDIKTQELALAIADANTAISKSMLYPSLRITAGGGVNAFKASNWFNIPASLFGTVAGGLAQPLLQHKELKTRYEVAKTEREQAVIRFRQSVLLAVGEVADALVRIDKLKEQYDITASRVQTLHQATGNAHLLFRNGMADYLEVITAESNVLRGELELAAIKRSELAAVTDLYKALGGGWR